MGTETRTTSGGAYYGTASDLRTEARTARRSYPEALERVRDAKGHAEIVERQRVADNLILQAVGFELAAALYCVAQAIEDSRP